MKSLILAVVATLVAGCMAGSDETNVGDSSGNENELAVNEIVNAGVALHVTASSLNLRSDGSTSASIPLIALTASARSSRMAVSASA